MIQTRCLHLTANNTLSIPGENLAQIVNVLNILGEQMEPWSNKFDTDFDYEFSTGFPVLGSRSNRGYHSSSPVKSIRFWCKAPLQPDIHRPVISIELKTHDGRTHSIMFNDLKFEEVKQRVKKLHDRFYAELLTS